MNSQAKEKIIRGRTALILEQPFFGVLALRLIPVESTDIPTLATDGKRMLYNPDFINKLEQPLVKSAICHEVMHCVYDHLRRLSDRDPKKWNVACDYPINELIKNVGMEIGKEWLYDPQYSGMSADHIYSLLPPGSYDDAPDHMMIGQSMDGKDELMSAADAQEWKIATAQAAQAAKMMGKLPGTLAEFIDNLLDSKVDWKTRLRQFITQRNESDYSWMRPNKPMLGAHGIYLPGLFSEAMQPLAVFKDISGSIDDVIQDAFNAEVRAIVQDCKPEKLHVMYVDTHVARYDTFLPDDEPKLVNIRGGGTSFIPPFERLKEDGTEPACAIYLTDMEGCFPTEDPGYPVLWVSINKHAPQPPFGEMIHIDI